MPLIKFDIFIVLKDLFSIYNIIKGFKGQFDLKNRECKKLQIFEQKHGLTPLQKSKFYHFFNSTFLSPRKPNFLHTIGLYFGWQTETPQPVTVIVAATDHVTCGGISQGKRQWSELNRKNER